ncbi:MAG: crosslink repair DNA glycosylase YcaQ family protein [Chloroflexota bacterium]
MRLSHTAAQAVLLAVQGLLQPPPSGATKTDVLSAIRRMHVLQIDTIHVVARSPYLVLWSRLGDYRQVWLDDLLTEGHLFEYWSHEACFLPIEDYPLYRSLMLNRIHNGWMRANTWINENRDQVERMLAFVRERGEVRSSDFVRNDGQKGTWWNWKPEKITLEMLHTAGELMIARRHNFQRIYALREQVVPDWDDAQALPIEEVHRTRALRAVQALGVTTAAWAADYFRTPKRDSQSLLDTLANEGALIRAEVEGWSAPAYIHPDNIVLAQAAMGGTLKSTLTTLLSPFDPLVWDRQRASALFRFDYKIECYTPAAKRRYGYFSLPILHRGALIGRLDPKAHRKEGIFEIKALHLEPGIAWDAALVDDLAEAIRACAAWHQTPNVVVRWSDPPDLAKALQSQMK